RLRGCGARGSRVRATLGSSDVTEIATEARRRSAAALSKSRSRSTRSDLVVMVNGCRVSSSTSRTDRLIGIGVGAHRDGAAFVARPGQGRVEQLRGLWLHEQARFEIHAGRQVVI